MGAKSLIATTWISLRPDSTIARKIIRPMRPNPLIPIFTVMLYPFFNAFYNCRNRESKMGEQILRRRRGPELIYTNDDTLVTYIFMPTHSASGFNGYT